MSPAGFPRLPGVPSDQRLLASAREGDERAFEAFVRRHRRSLLRYCRRMGLSDTRAEDVVQQALLRAWLALERGAEVHAPKAWLYRTVHNTAVNTLRGARDHVPLDDGSRVELAASAESDFERRVAVRQTLSDVAGLPRMQREAILLTAFDGRSHEEIALALGVTHGAVRGLLYRARATLRDAAAAVLPQPLLLWAGGLLGRMTPTATKLAELSAPAGNTDVVSVLAKGAALTATAAVLAVGTGVVPLPRHLAHRSTAAAQALGITPATAEAQTTPSSVTLSGTVRNGTGGGSTDSAGSRRSRPSRGTTRTPDGRRLRTGSDGTRSPSGSRDRSERSSSDAGVLVSGGEDELSGGPGGSKSGSGSEGPQASEPSPSDSSHGGRSAPECDHCSGTADGRERASHPSEPEPSPPVAGEAAAPSAPPPAAGAVTPTPSEALAEKHRRD
jgi:RNA polymerase sigma factor (sigma-70 family)